MATRIKWQELMNPVKAIEYEIKQAVGIDLATNLELRRRKQIALQRAGLVRRFVGTDIGFLSLKNLNRDRVC